MMIGDGGFVNLLKSQEIFNNAYINENMMTSHLDKCCDDY